MSRKFILLTFLFSILLLQSCSAPYILKEETKKTILAKAVITYKKTGIKQRALITLQTPSSFKIETLGPFGAVTGLLASNGKNFYSLEDGKIVKRNLRLAFLPLDLSPLEITSVLSGTKNFKGSFNSRIRYSLDEKGRLKYFAKLKKNVVIFAAKINSYKTIKNIDVPTDIHIMSADTAFEITYKQVELIEPLDSSFFEIEDY